MRILVQSNSIWSQTGDGTQAKYLAKAFQELGHEVVFVPTYGLQGRQLTVDGILHLPLLRDMWGRDIVPQYIYKTKCDLFVCHHDLWVLDPEYPKRLPVPSLAYYPIDSEPIYPQLDAVADRKST